MRKFEICVDQIVPCEQPKQPAHLKKRTYLICIQKILVRKRKLWHDRFKQIEHQKYINFARKCKNVIERYHAKGRLLLSNKNIKIFTSL